MENKENLKEEINSQGTDNKELKNPSIERKESEYKTLFSDARSCTVKIICRCERTDSYLDKLIDAEIKRNVLNDFDKSLLNEMAHGVIRWKRRLDWFLNGFYRGQYEKTLPEVKNALRVALYQILFLNKIPYSAAVNEAVEFIKKIHGDKHAAVVNGLLRTIIRTLDSLVWPTREIDEVNYLGIIQSHPNWMVRRWVNRFGFDEAEKLCEANNRRPFLSLRANRLRISPDELAEHLKSKRINYRMSDHLDGYFSIKIMSKIYADEFFKQGFFSVQDVSAGFMVRLLDPKETDYILDACAAPGGKTSQMAELMNNKGQILAVDKYLSRVEIMNGNLERLGITNTTTLHDDINNPESPELSEHLIGKFDKILLDVPCSGLGVLSKKPDIKWKRELEDIKKLHILQMEILENSIKYLKPGGVLVYSTCTTENEENADVIHEFLKNHPEFKVENAKNFVPESVVNEEGFIETFPHIHGIDGAFGARLVRIS
jgi:16S rRNA (cytosine967-C5)-methyltransferase